MALKEEQQRKKKRRKQRYKADKEAEKAYKRRVKRIKAKENIKAINVYWERDSFHYEFVVPPRQG